MWDPISLFYCAWILNIGMPNARLNVQDVIETREYQIIIEQINSSVIIREGV